MIMILFSWLVIFTASFLFGKTIVDRAYHTDLKRMGKLDIYIIAGLIFLNVYAQIFSIFYKVAGVACAVLGVGGGILRGRYHWTYPARRAFDICCPC